MPIEDLGQVLADSVAEVLEAMFFTSPVGEAEPDALRAGPCLSAALTFRGSPPGRFGVRLPPATGRRIAASFLGQEEETLEDVQAFEVVCELANMLCGSVLSRLEKDARFDLSPPQIETSETGCRECPTAGRAFELEQGPLAVWLELEVAA